MRHPEAQSIALECLKLAVITDPNRAVELAKDFYAFVADDDAAEKLRKVRDAAK